MIGLLALAGCAEIREARTAQDPASRRPGERTVSAQEAGLPAGAALDIDRGVALAVAFNPAVAIARARVEQSEAVLRQVDAGALPQAVVRGEFQMEKSGPGSPDRRIARTQGGSLQVSQLLYDFGRLDADRRQAFDHYVAAQSDLLATENDVAFTFRQAYFNVLKQQEFVRVAEETVRQFERRLEQVRGFVEVGARQKYDLTKAQVDVGNSRLNLVKARTALAVGRAALANALGLAEDAACGVEKPARTGDWTMPFGEAFEEALRRHPRYRALLLREEAARAAVDAAAAAYWPELSLDGSFSVAGGAGATSWRSILGPLAGWTVFNGGAKAAALRQSVAELRAAYAARAAEEQRLFLDLRASLAAFEDARESLGIVDLTEQAAAETLELVQGRYAAGRASAVEVTDAEVSLANARGQRIASRYDLEIAVAALERAIGRGEGR